MQLKEKKNLIFSLIQIEFNQDLKLFYFKIIWYKFIYRMVLEMFLKKFYFIFFQTMKLNVEYFFNL